MKLELVKILLLLEWVIMLLSNLAWPYSLSYIYMYIYNISLSNPWYNSLLAHLSYQVPIPTMVLWWNYMHDKSSHLCKIKNTLPITIVHILRPHSLLDMFKNLLWSDWYEGKYKHILIKFEIQSKFGQCEGRQAQLTVHTVLPPFKQPNHTTGHSTKRKCHNFYEIFRTGCTKGVKMTTSVQSLIKISSKWQDFRFSVMHARVI